MAVGSLSRLVLVFLVIGAFSVVASAPTAQAGHHGGGKCSPYLINMEIHIYGGNGAVVINKTTYHDGDIRPTYTKCGEWYTVSGTPSGGYAFYSWASDIGTFDAIQSATTIFRAASVPWDGGLTMVLRAGVGFFGGWGGYVTSDAYNSAHAKVPITQAAGTFTLPSSYLYVPASTPDGLDAISMWVGIGGATSSAEFWQAGVLLYVNSNNQPTINPVFLELNSANTCCNLYTYNGYTITPGDTISVTLTASDSSGFPSLTMSDSNAQHSWTINDDCNPMHFGPGYCLYSFTPDESTAEWAADVPVLVSGTSSTWYVMPNFATSPFSYGYNAMSATGFNFWDMAFVRSDGYTQANNAQYTVPSLLDTDGLYGGTYYLTGDWTLSYSTTAG